MEPTDYKLYDKIANKLRTWVLPQDWPQTGAGVLKAVNTEAAKLLPYINAFWNLQNGRLEFHDFFYLDRKAFQYWDSYLQKEFLNRFVVWLAKLLPTPDPIYYATYNLQNNRMHQYFQFRSEVLQKQFQFAHKGAFLGVPRLFCLYMGSPLTTIQTRVIGGQPSLTICTPQDVLTYGP